MRKYQILLLLIYTTIFSYAQQHRIKDNTYEIKQLSPQGIVLDKGWKFSIGDNPAYALPEYDDSRWQSIDPTKDIHDIPPLWKNTIVWFRLHFTVDTAISNALAMRIQQSGASEFYLNGKLIHRFGVVSADPNQVKAFSPLSKPVSLPAGKTTEQVLAVRYALQPHLWYGTHFGTENRGLFIVVNTIENAIAQYEQGLVYTDKSSIFKMGVFLILGILYLAFYLFYPTQKVNLYFSSYAFAFALFWALITYSHSQHQVQQWFLINNLLVITGVIANLYMLTAIYTLFEQRKGWVYYPLFAFGILSIPIGTFVYGWGWLIAALLFTNIVNLVITYIALKAVRNHKKGAWIIAAGGVGFLICWFIFTLQWFGFLDQYYIDLFTLAQLFIPVAVSIYLGYDFARTYRSLQQKLTEVERLSKEKQELLAMQKEALEIQVQERTAQLHQSLQELKTTQAQLVQREKMASLGELTAGIAHEIQNPLNFVNNFAEINTELLNELKQEVQSNNKEEVLQITDTLKDNEQKIVHHGKRADAIVKGMLQHSRVSTGEKQSTDLNALVDEYLRLSYHGMRAKEKGFTATIQTDFDIALSKLSLVPQDIGRVLLNLFNNAFYSMNEKKKQLNGTYEPVIQVTTRRLDNKVEVSIKDNGTGIPQKALEKIFQPFFTTKPTGEGTGLGLSLTYDIITKGHGGDIKVNTKEGEGTEFIIQLPV
ncbi:MAG: histidine kinase [Flavisolibacter sp.]|nr:histidine kinase [Flavisolibacter sp.]